jgi:hypothetical protein
MVILLANCGWHVAAQESESYFTVSGVVKDSQTKKKLMYVNVSVPGTNVGTVTNADGEFSLKIKHIWKSKEVEVSHIGYQNYLFSASGDLTGMVILLKPSINVLKEVVVRPSDPRVLLEEAIDRIAANYSKNSDLFSAFYRETVQKGKRYIQVAEAVTDVYKFPYNQSVDRDRVRISKGRRLLAPQKSDTLAVKLMGGPYLSILLDIVKNPDVLLDKEMLGMYDYTMEDQVNLNNRPQYVISFKPRVTLPVPLYYGRYFIDRENLAFTQIEFSLDMSDLDKATSVMLVKKPLGLHFKPYEFSFLVTYKQKNGVSYMNYIRSEAQFKCDWKRKLFSSRYDVISEMVMTDRNVADGKPFPYRESFTKDEAFSDKVGDFFDSNFWGAYNIIEPTESLDAAVNKLKKKQ